jgi:hypothetical protein
MPVNPWKPPPDSRDPMDIPKYDGVLGYSETPRQRAARLQKVHDEQEAQAAMNNGTYRQWKEQYDLRQLKAKHEQMGAEIAAREGH